MSNDKKIHIIMVGPHLDAKGGISSFAKYYTRLDISNEFRIIYHPTTIDGVKILKIFYFIKSLILFIIKLIFGRKTEIVHICSASGGSFYRKAIILIVSKIFKKAIIFNIHSGYFNLFYESGNISKKFYIKNILKLSDSILVLSKSCFSVISKITGKPNLKIIPNIIDISGFKSIAKNRKFSNFNVLTVGRLSYLKGTYDILEIVPDVLKEVPDAMFYLAGDGDLQKVRKLCKEKEMENNIILFGWLDRAKLVNALENASIFLLPSYYEGLPLSMLEAMATGLPVISTRVGGIPDVIEDGINGFLINPGQKEELCKKIIDLLKNRELMKKMGQENIRRVDSMFRLDHVVKRFYEEYRYLVYKKQGL